MKTLVHEVGTPPRRVTLDTYGARGATPILLLHGIPGWRGTWRKVAPMLAADRLVVAPDLVGFGESARVESDIHAATQSQVLLSLLESMDIGEVHVVGFDFGGPIAVSLIARLGRRVRSLALANTNLFTDTNIPLPLRIASVPAIGPWAFRLIFSRTGLNAMYFAAVKDRRAFPRSDYVQALAFPSAASSTRDVFFASLRDLRRHYAPVQANLPRISVPTVVAWGAGDPFFALEAGQRSAAAIRGARLVALAGCGHFVPEERPMEFAALIRANIEAAEETAEDIGSDMQVQAS
jgi:pimeloyl-ACP methyl ester carboxylesterase